MSSSSSMFRKAKEALKKGHKSAADRLRKEGNKLRREERQSAAYAASKKAETRKSKKKAKKKVAERNKIIAGLQEAVNYAEAQQTVSQHPIHQATARIMGHIKGDSPLMEETIRRELLDAQAMGTREAHDHHRMMLKIQSDAAAVNVVSGFMAICELAQQANGGALPSTMSMSGYTAAKVYDALKEVGYTTNGRQGVDRETIGRPSAAAHRGLGLSPR